MAKNDKEIVKSNELIMSKYSMQINEQKLAFTLISKINNYKDELNFADVEISLDEYAELTNKKSYRRYDLEKEVVENCRNLLRAIVEVKVETEKGLEWVGMSWFDRIKVSSEKNKVSATFGYEIRPYLYNLFEKFTKYNIKNISNFKCVHSARLYEIAKQYEKIGKRTIDLEELKECLQVKNKYTKYNNFKTKLLDIAINEINKYTDLKILYKEIKICRKVSEIEFIIKENKKNVEKMNKLENLDTTELMDILSMEIKEKYGRICRNIWKSKIAKHIDKKAIIETIEELRQDKFKKGDITSISSYFEGVLINKHEEQTGIRIKKIDMIEKVKI